jgi:electron transfer flavoprotein beta subunit
MNIPRIAVCVKPVPDPAYYDKITVDRTTKRLQRGQAPTIMNELDRHALEKALQLKEALQAEITVFSMAPANSRLVLLEALALGSDKVVLLNDINFAGADTLATAYTLARGITHSGTFDIILMGSESSDGGTEQVAAQLGELLGIPRFTHVISVSLDFDSGRFEVAAKHDSGVNRYRVNGPVLCGVTREIATPRLPTLRNIRHCTEKPLITLDAKAIEADPQRIGDAGSPTKAGAIYNRESTRQGIMLQGTPDAITDRILTEMRRLGVLSQA